MLTVGRITKLFGVKGEVVINLYDTLPDNFNWEEQPFFTKVEELVVPLFCESFARRGQRSAVVAFADIDNEKRAEMILDHEVMIESEEGDDDEFTFDDLIGFTVRVGRAKGEIVDFYDNDFNPLFEIELKGKRHLIPAVEEFIAAIDFEGRSIKFVLPEGLIE
ncbi:MAG: 16S rRNA processing protein RimM [Alistipes sp.]|nr:16S rRNA processing protein RimM [Alistipes sp.]MBP3550190.1 16S rRNA processing protein RimM [Alistipes sp.]MBQ3026268.1 16S rRNA processing protein RimM [Alistipes sp.]